MNLDRGYDINWNGTKFPKHVEAYGDWAYIVHNILLITPVCPRTQIPLVEGTWYTCSGNDGTWDIVESDGRSKGA